MRIIKSILTIIGKLYDKIILSYPKTSIIISFLVITFFIFQVPKFQLDASGETLSLENDQDVKYYRTIKARYGSDDFLVVTYSPFAPLFQTESIALLEKMHNELENMENVQSVTSIINIPLLKGYIKSFADFANNKVTITQPGVDLNAAKKELVNNVLYKNSLISEDGKTVTLLVFFEKDKLYRKLLKERNELREKGYDNNLSQQELDRLHEVSQQFKEHNIYLREKQAKNISQVRQILSKYKKDSLIYIGGVPMITVDSIDYIKNDIVIFGIGVFIFIIILLFLSFHSLFWTLIAVSVCASVSIIMMGFLGLVQWPVTAMSSNFISLLLILTLSVSIHIIVHYRELDRKYPNLNNYSLIKKVVSKIAPPCFYTSLTTMVAFASLLVSGIKPIIDFGWMMVIGIAISFIVAFTIIPSMLVIVRPANKVKENNFTLKFTLFLSNLVKNRQFQILLVFIAISIISVFGIKRLTVENSFLDYYKESTEIFQGMKLIDNQLGGTTPLDVIIDAPQEFIDNAKSPSSDNVFDLYMQEDSEPDVTSGYWYNIEMLKQIDKIHDYLDSLDQIGKVISITTIVRMIEDINLGISIDSFFLALLYKKSSDQIKETLLDPYISKDGNQIRFGARIFESYPNLRRAELIDKIENFLINDMGLAKEQVKVTGMVVLYNNILQSLFNSQILTLGIVFLAILIMFMMLFANSYIALITIIPNIIAAGMILGIMGWFAIPLDIMTITIAAICVGIAVDDAIHYVHRFTHEFYNHKSYIKAAHNSHITIGRAMYYTTVTITIGFSILILSNFVPTIYFGILLGLSMVIALFANMTLLPVLLIKLKPLGKET